MDLARKFVVEQLAQPGARNVLDLPVDWYLAENQRFGNMEFFNRIGHERNFNFSRLSTIGGPCQVPKKETLANLIQFKR
jgi:hypothetical protein